MKLSDEQFAKEVAFAKKEVEMKCIICKESIPKERDVCEKCIKRVMDAYRRYKNDKQRLRKNE